MQAVNFSECHVFDSLNSIAIEVSNKQDAAPSQDKENILNSTVKKIIDTLESCSASLHSVTPLDQRRISETSICDLDTCINRFAKAFWIVISEHSTAWTAAKTLGEKSKKDIEDKIKSGNPLLLDAKWQRAAIQIEDILQKPIEEIDAEEFITEHYPLLEPSPSATNAASLQFYRCMEWLHPLFSNESGSAFEYETFLLQLLQKKDFSKGLNFFSEHLAYNDAFLSVIERQFFEKFKPYFFSKLIMKKVIEQNDAENDAETHKTCELIREIRKLPAPFEICFDKSTGSPVVVTDRRFFSLEETLAKGLQRFSLEARASRESPESQQLDRERVSHKGDSSASLDHLDTLTKSFADSFWHLIPIASPSADAYIKKEKQNPSDQIDEVVVTRTAQKCLDELKKYIKTLPLIARYHAATLGADAVFLEEKLFLQDVVNRLEYDLLTIQMFLIRATKR